MVQGKAIKHSVKVDNVVLGLCNVSLCKSRNLSLLTMDVQMLI